MAITIGTTPLEDTASNATESRPVNQRLIYTATSDNYTENGFRFVVNVTSSDGSPSLDETFYIPSSPNGEMVIDIHDLISKKLQYEQSAESVHFITEVERERHLNLISVSFKEGYNVDGVFTIDDATEQIASDLFVFWGAYDGATGPYPPVSTFQMNATTGISSRALSDRKPKTLVWDKAVSNGLNPAECIFIPVRQNDFGALHVLSSVINDVAKVLYSIIDDSNTSHDESFLLNGNRQEVVPCYPANLNGGSLVTNKPASYIGWKYYVMQFAASDDTPLSAKYVFYPVEENCDHRNIRLAWKGHRGGWDYYNFQMKNFFTREVARNRFQRGYSGTLFSGQTRREYERQMKVDRFLDISTDFIADEEKALLQWLIQSPDVRIIRDNGTSIPVLVETNTLTGITGADAQPLEQVLIRLKYAGDELNFNGWFVDEAEAPEGGSVSEFDLVFASTSTISIECDVVGLFVDWGDGSTTETNGALISHTYAAGNYTIKIDNSFTGALKIGNAGITSARYLPQQATLLNLVGNKLSVSSVNAILQFYDAANTENYVLNLSSQTPSAPPSGAGATAKDNLIAKGWTVTTD
jgi:hypothetical protein